jgi:hypothetical protein
MAKPSLFVPIVAPERLNLPFRNTSSVPGHQPARDAMQTAYEAFEDLDGNFLQQFQTDGYEARLFELFLSVLFRDMGFVRDSSHNRPDFVLSRPDGTKLSVEAVTANPSRGAPPAVRPPRANEGIEEAIVRIIREAIDNNTALASAAARDEFRTRLARPLQRKLEKEYWTLPHVSGHPFVVAVQDFHAEGSNLLLSGPFADFLYGDFFRRANSERISAVMFVNNGTAAKFNRMRYQVDASAYPGIFALIRGGVRSVRDGDQLSLQPFCYQVGDKERIETWPEGITVFHHPVAAVPLASDVFGGTKQYLWCDGVHAIELPSFHPEMSLTVNLAPQPQALSHRGA